MTDEVQPQVPGAYDTTADALQELAEGNVGDMVEALEKLTDEELTALHDLELNGKNRTTALNAIHREMESRQGGEAPADPDGYANMRAADVDPTRLTGRVLTKDGWVLPLPSATAED